MVSFPANPTTLPTQARLRFALALIFISTLVTACGSPGHQLAAEQSAASVSAYLSALDTLPGDPAGADRGLDAFSDAFADLTTPDLAERIDQVYAPVLFFNDTVHTFTDREALKRYMMKTGANLTQGEVKIHQITRDEADVFVRWTMYFEIGEGNDAIRSTSIGISHLRFNADGQVILHQDYWDSAGALYNHLPLIGTVLRAAKARLAEE